LKKGWVGCEGEAMAEKRLPQLKKIKGIGGSFFLIVDYAVGYLT
jgi:hypothetical protein